MAYVPPHRRNAAKPTQIPSTVTPSPSRSSATRSFKSAPARSHSQTPWSTSVPTNGSPNEPISQTLASPSPIPSASAPAGRDTSVSPTLHVYGDSFVGPLKLLSDECVRINPFKGASAKGLNNPNSLKQVSSDLLPAVNDLLARPSYVYRPPAGCWALFIFGNVDLQINYLWQLQTKRISALSFPSDASTSSESPESSGGTVEPGDDGSDHDAGDNVLAAATETTLKGPALGPELFVAAVLKAYTSWLEREIVHGPVGQRLRDAAEQRRQPTAGPSRRPAPPPSKVLVAAALPPLVEDDTLFRIPEKYVERLEEEHEKARRAMRRPAQRGSPPPWSRGSPSARSADHSDDSDLGLSTLSVSDHADSPKSASSVSSSTSSVFDTNQPLGSPISSVSTSPPSPETVRKTPITELLAHDPPLCTLPIRKTMTDLYNAGLSAFCARFPDVLGFVDISPDMKDAAGTVNRAKWACQVDATNIHPWWEATLPLWLKALAEQGVPTDTYTLTKSAEETSKAYEEDKRRRTAARDEEWAQERILTLQDD